MSRNPGNCRNLNLSAGISVCFAGFILLAAGGVRADEFHLVSGKVVRGAVVSQTASEYVLQTDVGTLKISKSDVISTVDSGSTPIEVEGDIAARGGNYVKADASYRQALAKVPAGGEAATRIRGKMERLSAATQQLAQDQILSKVEQARGLVQSRQFDAAAVILDELASRLSSRDPLTSSVLQMQAQLHYGKGMAALDAVKLDVAHQELEAAVDADPSFFRAYLSLGDSLLDNSATVNRGIQLLEKGLQAAGGKLSEQERYGYQYKLAQKYFDQKDFAKAAAMYAALISARDKYPTYADALDRAVESYVRMGEENLSSDFRQTITNLNAALKLNPTNQKALFLLGRIYMDIGQVENAIVTLQKLVSLKGDYPEGHHYLGRAYFQAHNNAQALQNLTMEIAAHPGNYFTLTDRAEVLIAMGNYADAKADLAAAKTADPANWLAYYLTGVLALNQKNYDQARASLVEALDRKRTAVRVYLMMGRTLKQQGQAEGSRKWLEQVTSRLTGVPDLSFHYREFLADALTQLGELSLQENSPRQAENYLKQALQVVPDFVPAMLAMADTDLLLAKDAFVTVPKEQLFAEAEKLYSSASRIDPENPNPYLKLGEYYAHNKANQEQARKYYNLYVDKGGRDPQVNALLVEAGGQQRDELVVAEQAIAVQATSAASTMANSGMTSMPVGMVTTTTVSSIEPIPGMPTTTTMNMNPTANQTTTTIETGPVTGVSPAMAVPTPGTTVIPAGTGLPGGRADGQTIPGSSSGANAMPGAPPVPGAVAP